MLTTAGSVGIVPPHTNHGCRVSKPRTGPLTLAFLALVVVACLAAVAVARLAAALRRACR